MGSDIEIGWRLIRSAWGHGFAPEAARVVVESAISTVGLRCVVADIDPGNASSIRVAEKIGMKHVVGSEHEAEFSKRYAFTEAELIQ